MNEKYRNYMSVSGSKEELDRFAVDNLVDLKNSKLNLCGMPGLMKLDFKWNDPLIQSEPSLYLIWESEGLRDWHIAFEVAHIYPTLHFHIISLNEVEQIIFMPETSFQAEYMHFHGGYMKKSTAICAEDWGYLCS